MPKVVISRALQKFDELLKIMAALRDPESGCPWDLEQSFETIAPYTLEEAYEVYDAITRNDLTDLRDELGDLLLQVVFHSQIAAETGAFDAADVISAINDKMIRRHPHVFGEDGPKSAEEQTRSWEDIKAQERKSKNNKTETNSALDGVALSLPALMRAEKLQKRAARTGFDWATPEPIFEKLDEEADEVREALSLGDPEKVEEEVGDLLFVAANLARRLSIDPEAALRKANQKFERRFREMERLAREAGGELSAYDLDGQEALWTQVKQAE